MVETDVLREARRRAGLSYEAVARQLHIASKTYERYEKQGRVPRGQLERLADLLELEIETPERKPLTLKTSPPVSDTEAEIIERLDGITQLLEELREQTKSRRRA